MKTFIIGKDLEECKDYRKFRHSTSLNDLMDTVGRKLGKDFMPVWNSVYYPEEELQYSFFYMMSRAYSLHREVVIHPHDLWYMMLCRVAEVVNADPETYRKIFTRSTDKVDILIPSIEEGHIEVSLIIEKLLELVPVDVNVFLPKFSTLSAGAAAACMGAFCDMVKTYYNYMTFACGIKSITIAGTKEDWELFKDNFAYISYILTKANNANIPWMARIGFILDNIIESLYTDDSSFYKNIFTQQNVGSGGELKINGWICDFTSTKAGNKLGNFPLMVSLVPFKSLSIKREYTSAFGGFSSWEREGKFETLYSSIGFEKITSENKNRTKSSIITGTEKELWDMI